MFCLRCYGSSQLRSPSVPDCPELEANAFAARARTDQEPDQRLYQAGFERPPRGGDIRVLSTKQIHGVAKGIVVAPRGRPLLPARLDATIYAPILLPVLQRQGAVEQKPEARILQAETVLQV